MRDVVHCWNLGWCTRTINNTIEGPVGRNCYRIVPAIELLMMPAVAGGSFTKSVSRAVLLASNGRDDWCGPSSRCLKQFRRKHTSGRNGRCCWNDEVNLAVPLLLYLNDFAISRKATMMLGAKFVGSEFGAIKFWVSGLAGLSETVNGGSGAVTSTVAAAKPFFFFWKFRSSDKCQLELQVQLQLVLL